MSAWTVPKNFSWIIQGVLAGSARPDGSNPGELNFTRANFKSIICLSEDDYTDAQRQAVLSNAGEQASLEPTITERVIHIPVIDRTVPTHADFDAMARAISDPAHWPVLCHCRAGIGRTAYAVLAGFTALYLRQDEPSTQLCAGVNLQRLIVPSAKSALSDEQQQMPGGGPLLNGANLVRMLRRQGREVNISEAAVDFMIARFRAQLQPVGRADIASPRKVDTTWDMNTSLDGFRQIVAGVVSVASLPRESMAPADLVAAIEKSGAKTIIVLEQRSFTPEQRAAVTAPSPRSLYATAVRVIDVPTPSGEAPPLERAAFIASVFCDASSWPILLLGGRGRVGTAACFGIAALRADREPRCLAVGRSTNDLVLYIRSHIGPYAVENVEQEHRLVAINGALTLRQWNVVVPNVLSFAATPYCHEATLQFAPLLAALAIRSVGNYATVVLLDDPASIGNSYRNTAGETAARLRHDALSAELRRRGMRVVPLPCEDGMHPTAAHLAAFVDSVLLRPQSFPILVLSENGYARAMSVCAALSLLLASCKQLREKLPFLSEPGRLPEAAVNAAADNKRGDAVLRELESRYVGERPQLSRITAVQRRFVDEVAKAVAEGNAATTATATPSLASLLQQHITPPATDMRRITSVVAFGDWGADVDDANERVVTQRKQLQHFADMLAADAKANGAPDRFLVLGDNFYWNGCELERGDKRFAMWSDLVSTRGPELHGVVWNVVLGNHCYRSAKPEYTVNYSDLPHPENFNRLWQFRGRSGDAPSRMYSFRLGSGSTADNAKLGPASSGSGSSNATATETAATNAAGSDDVVAFVAWDSNAVQSRVRREHKERVASWESDRQWLFKELDAAQGSEVLWRIAFFHHPFWTSGLGHAPEGQTLLSGMTYVDGATTTVMNPIYDGLLERRTDLVLCGHEHETHLRVRGDDHHGALVQAVVGATMESNRYGRVNPARPDEHRADWISSLGSDHRAFARVAVYKSDAARVTKLVLEFVSVTSGKLEVIHRLTMVKDLAPPAAAAGAASAGSSVPGLVSPLGRGITQRMDEAQRRSQAAVVVVNRPNMLETLERTALDALRRAGAAVFTATSSAVAHEITQGLLARGIPIAAYVTNMRRARENSGILFLASSLALVKKAGLHYTPPCVMFSWNAAAKLAAESYDAGAFALLHTDTAALQTLLESTMEAGQWARKYIDAAEAMRKRALAQHDDATLELGYSHCYDPLPSSFGGAHLLPAAQQLFFTVLAAAFDKLVKPLTACVVEETTAAGVDAVVTGEAALNYWSLRARGGTFGDTRGRTACLDVVVVAAASAATGDSDAVAAAAAAAARETADKLVKVVEGHSQLLAAYIAHAGMRILFHSGAPAPAPAAPAAAPAGPHGASSHGAPPAASPPPLQLAAKIVADAASGSVSIELELAPIGQLHEQDPQPANATPTRWQLVRIHSASKTVPTAAAAAAAASSSSTYTDQWISKNTVEVDEQGTRFCGGLLVLAPEATLHDREAASSAWSAADGPEYARRKQLQAQYMRTVVLPALAKK